jgi:hypothetical protein
MQLKLKIEQLPSLFQALTDAITYKAPESIPPNYVKFGYAVAKNRRIVKAELDSSNEALLAFEKARAALCEEFASKGPDGTPLVSAQSTYIIPPPKRAEFDSRFLALRKEYRVEEHLNSEIDLSLHAIPFDWLPPLPPAIIDGIFSLITEKESDNG